MDNRQQIHIDNRWIIYSWTIQKIVYLVAEQMMIIWGSDPKLIEIINNDTVSKFNPPVNSPSEYEIRKMFSVAIEHLIKQAMENHVYSFNGQLRKQSAGAAIGTTLSGAIAALFMVKWS